MEASILIIIILGGIIALFLFLHFVPVNLWITARFSGVKVGLVELIFMRIRKVPPRVIIESMITSTKGRSESYNQRARNTLPGRRQCTECNTCAHIGRQSEHTP